MRQESQRSQMGRYSGKPDLLRPCAGSEVAAIFGPRIYLVDRDPLTRALLVDYLRDKGFDVVAATDMEAPPPLVDVLIVALSAIEQQANRPQWLVAKPEAPIIVLDRSYVFQGRTAPLGFAPDARLSLPIHPRKLVATIRRILNLARIESVDLREASARVYRFSGWSLYPEGRRLESHNGKSILLGKREFEVLRALLTFPRQLLTRQQLIAVVWGSEMAIENRTLDRPITRLRHHLGDDVRYPVLIKTVVGIGYRLDAEVEKSV